MITTFITKLLVSPTSWDMLEVQSIVKVLYRLANTSPEICMSHWTYQSANLIQSPATRVWLAANKALGSNWLILDQEKLGPKPAVVLPAAKAKVKTGIVNTKNRNSPGCGGNVNTTNQSTPKPMGILRPASSTRRKTALGNFRFSKEVTVENIFTPMEELTSKAPRLYKTFITIRTPALEEGGNISEKFILDNIHAACEYLWEVDPTMVLYSYPGKIQHSAHVLPYKKKHTCEPQSRKYRKIASTAELRRYTDRVIMRGQKSSWINFFIGHSAPITDLTSSDVTYRFDNDQMQLIVKDIQSPEAINAIWLVGMDPMTTDCQELTDTLRQNDYYKKLPIHVKVQTLKIRKTDTPAKYGTPDFIRVVTVQCAKHLRKITVTALRKTFNSEKPKHVENRPNGTPAKMVEWYGDAQSPNPNRDQFEVAMIAKSHHKKWLDKLIHINLDMAEELYIPIMTPVEGEITLHQVLISIRSKTNYACNIFQAIYSRQLIKMRQQALLRHYVIQIIKRKQPKL